MDAAPFCLLLFFLSQLCGQSRGLVIIILIRWALLGKSDLLDEPAYCWQFLLFSFVLFHLLVRLGHLLASLGISLESLQFVNLSWLGFTFF